jgi:hypothetical protein
LGRESSLPGGRQCRPSVREAHLKNEDIAWKKLAFSLAYASFFYAQELAIYLFQTGAYCLFLRLLSFAG